ncbi:1-acylglycerol-3-phosphate O-acyltransferase [Lithohypha guttulata]|uniref:1-acyl-sn-glycerol-3-phosphate acyltransferase n=1 Tax=Lithohypha guttulata TaxID=1690604 RepID=A0AAN7STJ9_9EURO|nr:1-acylglycerol-3-phosphate O-acyltransferase [Lithohypha guttulata]
MYAVVAYPLYGLAAYVAIMLLAFVGYNVLPSPPLLLGFIARSMSAYLALMICAAYGTIASGILNLLDLHYKYGQWTTARSFKYVGKIMMGVEFDIEPGGQEILDKTKPAVIVANHQTELDILMLGSLFPQSCSVTAKKSIARIPLLGWYMLLSGTVFIDRANRAQAMKAFERAAKTMKERQQSVFMFPEGTRSYSREPMLLPFKKGAFHMAVQGQVPIIPAVAENYSYILDVKARRFNAGRARIRGKKTLHECDLLRPIETKGKTAADVDALLEETRGVMLKALHEMAQDNESKMISKVQEKKES